MGAKAVRPEAATGTGGAAALGRGSSRHQSFSCSTSQLPDLGGGAPRHADVGEAADEALLVLRGACDRLDRRGSAAAAQSARTLSDGGGYQVSEHRLAERLETGAARAAAAGVILSEGRGGYQPAERTRLAERLEELAAPVQELAADLSADFRAALVSSAAIVVQEMRQDLQPALASIPEKFEQALSMFTTQMEDNRRGTLQDMHEAMKTDSERSEAQLDKAFGALDALLPGVQALSRIEQQSRAHSESIGAKLDQVFSSLEALSVGVQALGRSEEQIRADHSELIGAFREHALSGGAGAVEDLEPLACGILEIRTSVASMQEQLVDWAAAAGHASFDSAKAVISAAGKLCDSHAQLTGQLNNSLDKISHDIQEASDFQDRRARGDVAAVLGAVEGFRKEVNVDLSTVHEEMQRARQEASLRETVRQSRAGAESSKILAAIRKLETEFRLLDDEETCGFQH